MAKQDIDIGVEGNDGTGDSIRESFRKVNENFNELYAVFGAGGQISFTNLGDTPNQLIPRKMLLVNDAATALDFIELSSDSALGTGSTDSVLISYDIAGKIILRTSFRSVASDESPSLGGPLDGFGYAIANVTISEEAVNAWNDKHSLAGGGDITIDDLVITKGYADNRYIAGDLPIRIDDEPSNANEYVFVVQSYSSGNIVIPDHGYDRTINGTPYVFRAEDTDPPNLVSGTTYFLRYFDKDQFSIHRTLADATVASQSAANANKVNVTYIIDPDDEHTFTDAGYDSSLAGNFLANEAMPRKSIVRRQGDTMTGPLILHDSPGELAGLTSSPDELQAATKFYVDNTSYSSPTNLYVSTSGDDTMGGVPAGKEGTAWSYAYKSINAAARRAEEIIRASESEPGPYMQTITKDNGASEAEVISATINNPVFGQTRSLLQLNKEYIIREVSAYLAFEYPNFEYNVETCQRDLGLIIDAISFDINRSQSLTLATANSLTRLAAERYYSNPSARLAITRQQTQTVDAINKARDIAASVLLNRLYLQSSISGITQATICRITTSTNHGLQDGNIIFVKNISGMTELNDNFYYVRVISNTVIEIFTDENLSIPVNSLAFTAYGSGGVIGVVYQTDNKQFIDTLDAGAVERQSVRDKFDLVTTIIQNGLDSGANVVYGKTYKIVVDNGGLNSTDQGNLSNRDVLPGKTLVGKISGAQGRVVSYTSNSGPDGGQDVIEVHLLKAIDFIPGEGLEYGNFVKRNQVTILVESGQYEEDYPIKVSANVSVVGDEFRRVIIRPKDRVSQSPWASTYIYRDRFFDGLSLADSGYRFYNQTNEWQGYFGYHYLSNPEKPINTGVSVINAGSYESASAILKENKLFIQEEVLNYINNNFQDLLYDKTQFREDLESILTGITYDMVLGTNFNAVLYGLKFQRSKSIYLDSYLKELWVEGLTEAKRISAGLIASITATGELRLNNAFDEIIDIIQNGVLDTDTAANAVVYGNIPSTEPNDINAKNRLQNNREFIAQEALAYLQSIASKKYIDSAIRLRDIRKLVDALSYDIQYSCNFGTTDFVKDLFVDNVLRLEITTREETIEVLTHLKDVISDIVLGNTVTPTTGNAESQSTTGSNASSAEATTLGALVDIVISQLDNNNLLSLPIIIFPSIVAADVQLIAAKSTIDGAIIDIQDNAISVIDSVAVFNYNQAKCRRDVGLIVDALVDDLLKGGDEFATEVQGEYFESYIQQFNNGGFGGQENVTKGAIEYIATIAQRLFQGSYNPALYQQDDTDADFVAPDFRYGTGEAGTATIVNNLIDKIVFAFDRRYNPPKRNDQMDAFLMNDATILRNITVQGHGGFMCVLDPAGQILTKSPYIQTGSSFSKSINAKTFSGGMFVDAYSGNLPAYIPSTIDVGNGPEVGKINNFVLWVRSEEGQGLFVRPPELPCPFYIEGRRYQVNAISDYDQSNGWCKIYLDNNSNNGVGYDETQFDENPGEISRTLYLQTAGNRSMLGNDFTQINDLGYGLVTTNGAFSEMVSMFTYYCHAAYYAANGSEIRSLNGSNGYGNFGLVAEGADPNEIPDQIVLAVDMSKPAKTVTFTSGGEDTNIEGSSSIFLTDMKDPPQPNSIVVIHHGGAVGTKRYRISAVSINTEATPSGGIYNDNLYRLQITGLPNGENGDFYNALQATVPNGTYVEYRDSETFIIDGVRNRTGLVTRPSTAINFDESDDITYRSIAFSGNDNFGNVLPDTQVIVTVEVPFDTVEIPVDLDRVAPGTGGSIGDTTIAIRIDDAFGNNLDPIDRVRLVRDIAGRLPGDAGYSGGMVFTWNGRSHQINNLENDLTGISPVDFVSGRSYTISALGSTNWNTVAGTTGVTYQVGDNFIAVATGSGDGSATDDGAYLLSIESAARADITIGGPGIAAAFTGATVLYAGIPADTTGEVTISISLCRATGHDFTQIGTGSFNESNYPNVILGPATKSLAPFYVDSPNATSGQVWERRKGRVFWMSTDQYGFFRVGKFFSVDQGQGSISFSGEIGITGANELGFKKGVPVDEFSTDDTMSDESDKAVPVEKAIVGYINKRLGRDKNDSAVPGRIGPGFLALSGSAEMEGQLQMGNNKITNLATPTSGSDSATKSYVDNKVLDFDSFETLRNVSENRSEAGDILIYTGYKKILISVPVDSGGAGRTFAVDDTIEDSGGSKEAIIKDIIQTTDDIVGEDEPGNNIWILVYELQEVSPGVLSADFNDGELIEGTGTKATVSATILRGPFNEVGHAREAADSVINFSITRTKAVVDDSLTDPIAEINFQIQNESIINADISPSASIIQSKLLMERAEPLSSSTGLFGTDDNVGQISRGLAAFDATHLTHEIQLTLSQPVTVNAGDYIYQGTNVGTVTQSRVANTIVYLRTASPFVSGSTILQRAVFSNGQEGSKTTLTGVSVVRVDTSGFIGLKERSIGFDKLAQIATDTVLGRSKDGTGDVEAVSFSDIIDQGFGLQDVDFLDSEITTLSGQIITFATDVSVENGTTLVQNQGSGVVVQGTVQGKVLSERTVRVVNVINATTLAAANFNTASISTSTGTALGSPTGVATGQNLIGSVLVKQGEGAYGTTSISIGSAANTIARRTASGAIQANSYIIGGSSSNEILTESGGTLTLKAPGGGTILTANGSTNPTVNIPGNINNGTTGITQSSFQGGSDSNGDAFVSTNWLYSPFIEAPGERDSSGTGISLGAGTGFANSAADTILLITNGEERLRATTTGVVIDGTLSASGNFSINSTRFTVDGSTGNTSVLGTLTTAGISATSGSFSTNVTVTGNLTANGNVVLGDAAADTVSINGSVNTNIIPNGSRNIGSSGAIWNTVYATTFSGTATTARYADLAENYLADADYDPGTVLVFGGPNEVTANGFVKGDRRVAGVISTNPAHLMNSALEGEHVVAVALQGRVPCKVIGKVNKGDILVTSAISGYAMVDNDPKIGTIIGKAVAEKLDDGRGVVEVVVGKC